MLIDDELLGWIVREVRGEMVLGEYINHTRIGTISKKCVLGG